MIVFVSEKAKIKKKKHGVVRLDLFSRACDQAWMRAFFFKNINETNDMSSTLMFFWKKKS